MRRAIQIFATLTALIALVAFNTGDDGPAGLRLVLVLNLALALTLMCLWLEAPGDDA